MEPELTLGKRKKWRRWRQQGEWKRRAWAEFSREALLRCSPFGHGQRQQQDPLEPDFAVLVGIPFGLRVRAAALAPRAHGQGRDTAGEWNVGIGRTQAKVGPQTKMPVDPTQGFEQR